MDPIFAELIKAFGLPIALFLYAFATGAGEKPKWVFGREHRVTVERLEGEIERLADQIEFERTQHRTDLKEERDLNLRLLGVGERVTEAVATVTSIPPRRQSRRPSESGTVTSEIRRLRRGAGDEKRE